MNERLEEWIAEAQDVVSYTKMYRLAGEIATSVHDAGVQEAARTLFTLLKALLTNLSHPHRICSGLV